MAYSMNQIALYLNLAAKRVQADGSLRYLTGNNAVAMDGGGAGQETQILFVRDALWIANNDDADSALQKRIIERLAINTPEALIAHVETYQGRVFPRRIQAGEEVYAALPSPTQQLLFELAGKDDMGRDRAVPYPAPLVLPVAGAACANYTIRAPGAMLAPPPVRGIVFVIGNYDSTNDAENQHAEQKLLAALSKVPDNIRGTLPLYGCKRACNVCAGVIESATAKLKRDFRYLNSRGHDDPAVENYAPQFHAANIKILDVDAYYG